MSIGVFTDRSKMPDARNIDGAVGLAELNWRKLNDFLATTLKLKGELKFYGVNYGWAIRYAKSGKSVVALYPDRDSFTVQIIMKRQQLTAAYEHGVSDTTKEAVNRATDFKEGRWVFVHVDAIISAVSAHAGKASQADDMTVVVLERK